MKPFEFILVLFSIVVSLALTHLLGGIGKLIRAPKVRLSFFLLGWVAYLIFECVDFWFSLWHSRDQPWTMGVTLWTLAGEASLYLACWLALPDIQGGEPVDLVAFYQSDRRRFLAALIVYMLMSTVPVLATTGMASGLWTVFIVAGSAAAAWIWLSRWVQGIALVAAFCVTAYWEVAYVWRL